MSDSHKDANIFRLNLALLNTDIESIDAIAEDEMVSRTEILRRAVRMFLILTDRMEHHDLILRNKETGEERGIEFL